MAKKLIIGLLLGMLALNLASAYGYDSNTLIFKEDIKGTQRGFTLVYDGYDSSRNTCGYWDWSYRPRPCGTYVEVEEGIPEKIAMEAFKTFSKDSQAQLKIHELKVKRSYYPSRYSYSNHYQRYYRF